MIRSIRPTDLASLLAFLRKGHSNDAKTGRNLGRRERRLFSLGRFLQEWLSLDEDRYTWIDISRSESLKSPTVLASLKSSLCSRCCIH